jgi:glycosyltransferase involved in cell wall biosynthesis
MTLPVIALLGRKDEPTDAVEEYCRYLGDALQVHDFQMQICRVQWEIHGWSDSLNALRLQSAGWKDCWVLVQYTALAWSSHGFPQKVLRVLDILKYRGARVGIVFHDVEPYPGARLIDSVRRVIQIRTMRRALSLADCIVSPIPLKRISWFRTWPTNAAFIPVGPNLPISLSFTSDQLQSTIPTIGVFSITGGEQGASETRIIVAGVRCAAKKLGKIRLSVFGRHAEVREAELRGGLRDLPVEVSVEGVVEPAQVVQKLSLCDVLLFVRGPISSRRSSAIAGIACGLPIIAYPGSETDTPITEAGVVLVSPDQPDDLNAKLVRVLSDAAYRRYLSDRSRAAYQTHFAWSVIAAGFNTLLNKR